MSDKKFCPIMSARAVVPSVPAVAAGPESVILEPLMVACQPESCAWGVCGECGPLGRLRDIDRTIREISP